MAITKLSEWLNKDKKEDEDDEETTERNKRLPMPFLCRNEPLIAGRTHDEIAKMQGIKKLKK